MLVKRCGMKQKNKKADFLVWGTLDASLLGNLLINKGTVKAGEDTIRWGEGTIRGGQDF